MSNARQEVITQNGVFGNVCRVTTNIRMRKKFLCDSKLSLCNNKRHDV
jgi:hypothetical protein